MSDTNPQDSGQRASEAKRLLPVVTKSVIIQRPPADIFAFLADALNWPRWAIHNIRAIQPAKDGMWTIETPRGPGQLRLKPVASLGILDHEFIDAQEGHWEVPARVVAAADASVFLLTFAKPDPMPEEAFHAGMRLLDEELATLKGLLEA